MFFEQSLCLPRCDPSLATACDGCPETDCTFLNDVPAGAPPGACVPAGVAQPGDPCAPQTCGFDLRCVGPDNDLAFCRALCTDEAECTQDGFECLPLLGDDGEPTGELVCAPPIGPMQVDEPCNEKPCAKDLLCVIASGGAMCRPVCSPDKRDDCPLGEACVRFLDDDGDVLGYACIEPEGE